VQGGRGAASGCQISQWLPNFEGHCRLAGAHVRGRRGTINSARHNQLTRSLNEARAEAVMAAGAL
jgi:hypothetical protein